MKIVTKTGNLLTGVSQGYIMHSCNSQGVMSGGFAKGIKETYPEAYKSYRNEFESNGLLPGTNVYCRISNSLMIVNAIGQGNFGYDGKRYTSYDALATCFEELNLLIPEYNQIPKEIHIPLLGAARGGGNWEIIREIIEQTMDYPVTLWLPDNTVTTL